MKILSVTFKNINALKGRWHIDFTNPPLKEAGIFVICGPTGSGKTSILDAITLALYGETDRLQKKNIDNIMTRHTADCYCEVVFQVKQNIYKSHWSIRRSRGKPDGKVQVAKRLLYDMNNDPPLVIAEKILTVQEQIELITGLDFKRFSRSMMLAQGRFAEFLNAPDRDRAELLEKITGTDIYSKLSIKAFERTREEKEKLTNLRAISEQSFSSLSPEEIENFQKELISTKNQALDTKTIIQSLQRQKEQLKRIDRLIEEKKRINENLSLAHKQEINLQPKQSRLKRSNLAREFQSDIDSIDTQQKRFNGLTKEIESINDQLINLQSQLKTITIDLDHIQKQFESAHKKKAETEPLIQKVYVIDKEIETYQNQFEMILAEHLKLSSNSSHLKTLKKNTDAELEKIISAQKKNTEWLHKNAHNENLSEHIPYIQEKLSEIQEIRQQYISRHKKIAELKKQLEKFQKEINNKKRLYQKNQKELDEIIQQIKKADTSLRKNLGDQTIDELEYLFNESRYQNQTLESLQKVSNQFIELRKAIKTNRKNLKQSVLSRFTTHKKLKHSIERIEKENQTLNALAQAVQHELLVANYSDHRHLLESGKPCPLCGSPHHPYVQEKKISSETTIQKEYENKKKEVEKLNQKRESLKEECVKYDTLISSQINMISQNTTRQIQLNQEWDSATNEMSFLPLIHQCEEINRFIKETESRTNIYQKRYHESRKINHKNNQLKNSLQEKKENNFTLNDEIKTTDYKIKRISHDIQEISIICNDIQARGEKLSQMASEKLSRYQLNVPESGQEIKFIKSLKQKASQYKEHLSVSKKLENDIQKLGQQSKEHEIEIKTLSQQILTIDEKKKQYETKLKNMRNDRYQLLKDKNPDQEKKRLIDTVEKCEKQLKEYQQIYLASEKKISSMETLRKNKQEESSTTQLLLDQKQQSLMNLIEPKGFDSIKQLKKSILSHEESKEIQRQSDSVQRMIQKEQTRLDDISEQLTQETKNILTEESLDALKSRLSHHETEYEKLTRRMGSIEQVLIEENKRADARKKTIQELNEQEKQFNRWNDLNALIGSSDGNAFRTFAQGLTLNRLIDYSNQHLKTLSDRYLLQRLSPQLLTLNIMDTYQANTLRPTNTLSGGESFLVSLSMALGLSDLAGNNIRVESLFLDEGFGALDEETLDIALSAIERLNLSGKMIGVISHIESLKERIPVHVEVSKIAGGNSRIDIVSVLS